MGQPTKEHFISIHQIADDRILELLDIADAFKRHGRGVIDLHGKILATLFVEPSTRTRLSFEAAMLRLGGAVVTVADPKTSSISKGETLADTARIVSAYGDALVVRHPLAGSARLAADFANVAVVNAGDGGHEHPSQTLLDLFTIRERRARLDGLLACLYGDLAHGRTTHSLAPALLRSGSDVLCLAEPGLGLPESVRRACAAVPGVLRLEGKLAVSGTPFRAPPDAVLFTRDAAAHQRGGFIDAAGRGVDVLYVTRLQRERLDAGQPAAFSLPRVDPAMLACRLLERAVIMHPLPRVGEIDPALDRDPRAAYFDQAANGVPVRMALLAVVLGARSLSTPLLLPAAEMALDALVCRHRGCIRNAEPDSTPALVSRHDDRVVCSYCDQDLASA